MPTLNAMDNNGEAYATVLIIDGTRVNDVRVYEDGIMPTVISRYGTGGGNVPMIFEEQPITIFQQSSMQGRGTIGADEDAQITKPIKTQSDHQMIAMAQVVRRLTPVECERLQGFPDGWTDGQADSNRYKQMGNAVAVPVVEWIISRMVGE